MLRRNEISDTWYDEEIGNRYPAKDVKRNYVPKDQMNLSCERHDMLEMCCPTWPNARSKAHIGRFISVRSHVWQKRKVFRVCPALLAMSVQAYTPASQSERWGNMVMIRAKWTLFVWCLLRCLAIFLYNC